MNKSGIAKIAASQHVKEKEYWENKLSGDLVKSYFPYDYNKIDDDTKKISKIEFDFSGELYSRFMKLSNGSDTRLFMILVTGINLLLDRYMGNKNIIIGTPIFKQEQEAEFINTVLALKNDINREGTFKELLLQVKDTIFEATENQNYPIEALLYQLGMDEEENDFPLFDVAIILENVHNKEYLNKVNNNVTILFNSTGDCIKGEIEYNTSLYEKDTIERIINHLKNMFINALSNVNLKLGEIDILTDEEKKQVLSEFNDTSASYIKDKTISNLFEEQVEKTPEEIAVKYGDEKLTYNELNTRANRLARTLKEKGISENKDKNIVGIMIERSLEMVIGMMAILKAGGAYLPIDPEYPKERKDYMFNDSNIDVLLINGEMEEEIGFDGTIIDLAKDDVYSDDDGNLDTEQDVNSLAYIIYTSGSTGQPKGVLVEHSSIINTLAWRKDYYKFDNKDVVLQIPSFSFDSSIEDIFTPLISGSSIVLLNHEDRFNISYLKDMIDKEKVTHFLITPGLYKVLLDQHPECLKQLRIITVAGDKFTEELVKEHFEKLGNVRFINEYGPTENSVCTTAYELTAENTRVLIGKPINNVKCYILDKYGSLCPVGIPGELCVSGDGLTKGYLNRSELTDEKFVVNTFEDNKKMYKTGDLVRWMNDGNIQFLGRVDHQVKIRGFRIELGEIESQLLTHEHVKETIVIAKESCDGSKYLVQYFTAEDKIPVPELKWCLADTLPEYMIPAHFVQLDRMPLTPNGKIDRKALPEPEESASSQAEYEEPRNEVEKELVEMWQEILDREKIGINDNFFEIGGHSLRATVLVSKVRKKFHVDVPLREIFRKPTIKELAKYIERGEKNIYVAIEPVEEKDYYPASPAQKRMYLVNKVDGVGVTYNVPMAISVDGLLDREKTQQVFEKIIERHEAFRTSFEFIEDELVQKVHPSVDFEIEYKEAEEKEVPKIGKDFVQTFDFKKAPLLRVLLINLKEGRSVVIFDMHHIISDGISMDIVVKEFVTLYEGKELPELRIQYKDFTAWQKDILNSDNLKKQKEFWLEEFSGDLPVLNMPTDYPRPPVQSFDGIKIRTKVNSETTEGLLGLANKAGTTLFSVLLGAYNALLYRYTGQEDIIVGTPIAGRTSSDLENMVGMFINMIALRNYPEGDKSFKDFIKEVGEKALSAFENQDYQFNDLVDSLHLDRDMSRSPLFSTMFALQNMEFRQNEIDEMKFTLEDVETEISKFDITVIAVEKNEEIELIFEYCTKLYNKETIERLSNHFINLLNEIVKSPEGKICDIAILTDKEQKQLIEDFNNTGLEYDKTKTVHKLFEEQVEKTPDNIVTVFKDQTMTYSQLNEKANMLANTLRDKGVNKEDVVGIMVEESIEMLVGIMGIFKAGAAYLPIDPQYPEERKIYMLNDSKATILLTQGQLMDKVEFEGTKIDLDKEESYIGNGDNIESVNKSDDMAYVIYTSGSTGKPKGVMVEHKSLVNLSKWHINEFEITADDASTKYAGFGFDASVWEIFPYIISGASIHIIEKDIRLNTVKLNEYFEKNNITISFLPTQICEQFMELNNSSLRKLLTGGDKLNQFIKKDYELVNNYGPTENAVVATSCTIEENNANIPIGKPISNNQIYILDKNNNLQPVGVPGELCISGDSLARGYLGRPELTEEKFVVNPFNPEQRMYRTGDLARWLSDGSIEFLGRIDYQVKIRGNRIELGEVENQLLKHDEIKEAIVTVRDDKGVNKYLCGYIVAENEMTVADIKEHLSKELPDYMVPSYFIQIDELPTTSNGKIDRKALPEPDGSVSTGVEYVEPAGEMEEKLVAIWQEVLEVEKIGTNDNFFDLGGNSLLIMKVISKICSTFDVSEEEITVMTMFKYPTIALMSKELEGETATDKSSFDKISNRIGKRNNARRRPDRRRGTNE